jgi:hypothetical protein
MKSPGQNKSTAARLAKAFQKAILEGGLVEIFHGFSLNMTDAASLIELVQDDWERKGGTLDERLNHYMQDALSEWIMHARNANPRLS